MLYHSMFWNRVLRLLITDQSSMVQIKNKGIIYKIKLFVLVIIKNQIYDRKQYVAF